MQYYISWTHSDPAYHEYIPGLGVLVSPPNVSFAWSVTRWRTLPPALIVDSGAYQQRRERRIPQPAAVLSRQMAIIADQAIPSAICHLDVPLLATRDVTELDRRVERSLFQARWLIERHNEGAIAPNVTPMGVIQGYGCESVYTVARILQDMGYMTFAVGSLAGLATTDADEVLRRVESAMEAVGPNLHVLGVSSVGLLPRLAALGIRSADSSAPIREASMGGVVYSRPFRRYKVASEHFREWHRNYHFSELLEEPLPCDCPVCQVDGRDLMQVQGKHYVNLRALHNCYHLARAFAAPS